MTVLTTGYVRETRPDRLVVEEVAVTEWREDGTVWTREYIDGVPQEWVQIKSYPFYVIDRGEC